MKIITEKEIEDISNRVKTEGKRIVTLNGAFDVLHKGHSKIIQEAKRQGDVLFVGLNSDSSIKKRKGKNRPINNIKARLLAMSANTDVDYTFEFTNDTPLEFLDKIKPDVHVNGSDYGVECIEKPIVEKNGGEIYVVDLLEGYSSTALIDKM